MKVATQGQRASYHDIAARKFFGDNITTINCDLPFKNVFEQLKTGNVDAAVVAIENSLYGSINEVYDLLLKYKPVVVGEVYLHISQCLVGFPETKIADITEVHSHPIALAQCEDYLDTTLVHAERFEHNDTAGSVADIKKWADPHRAAIASQAAAEHHGMAILDHDIESNKQNYTRFVVLQNTPRNAVEANKTSLVLRTPADTKPGALYRALGTFAKRELNVLMLQSRPVIGRAWHYMFYVDVVVDAASAPFQEALSELNDQGCSVTILGSYANGQNTPYKA